MDFSLAQVLTTYQLPAIFFGSFFFGETVILTAAFLGGQNIWSVESVFWLSLAGTIAADSLWFLFGQKLFTLKKGWAMRNRKMYVAHQILALIPLLGGERAMKKALWQKLPDCYKQYFKIETALNFYAHHYGNGFRYKIFTGLTQVIKEKKYGLSHGLRQRVLMTHNILSAQFMLYRTHLSASIKNKKLFAPLSLQNFVGVRRRE